MSILRLISQLRARLFAALAIFFTQPVKPYRPATTTDPESLSAVLRNGDVLLTEGNTRAAALIKRITRSTWSHVSMYVGQIGGEYDLKHAWVLARSFLGMPPKASTPPAPNGIAESATRFICSSLLANAFALVGYPILPIHTAVTAVSTADHRYVIPGDFERAPVFEVVSPRTDT